MSRYAYLSTIYLDVRQFIVLAFVFQQLQLIT